MSSLIRSRSLAPMWVMLGLSTLIVAAEPAALTVQANQGKAISPDLFGIFFEDLSYAADGGLYAELIENRSFEYIPAATPKGKPQWNALTSWELVQRGSGKGAVSVADQEPLNATNPHYAVLTAEVPGNGVGLSNDGFDNIVVKADATYEVSLFARQISGTAKALLVNLETADGKVIASATLKAPTSSWAKATATLKPTVHADHVRLVVLITTPGVVALDVVSLFPQATFKNHPNGLRADLAQVIADLHPKFMRFPGGCIAHGDWLGNWYRWKDSIGPIEVRKGQPNRWQYYQSYGLGYFEYFQFCEDIGAKPLPVLPMGLTCQFPHGGQKVVPMADMHDFVQDALDLIEYANGSATSTWGSKRAAAGHPKPFNLQYLGIGNEEQITPAFTERFQMIAAVVKAKYPTIIIVGTAGPFPAGKDFDLGWKFAREQHVDLVDEHYYRPPKWFLDQLTRYDNYPRTSGVYAGEYAAHDDKRRSTLRSALSEAAYLTHLERNGDVVRLSSYAPLLAKYGHINWAPNLIFFDDTRVVPTINYQVQRMFSTNAGSIWMPITSSDPTLKAAELACSAVKDATTHDLIVKLVNNTAQARLVTLAFDGFKPTGTTTTITVLAGTDLGMENNDQTKQPLEPIVRTIPLTSPLAYEVPAYSLSVLRFADKP